MNKKYTYLIVVFLILASFIAFGRIMGNDFINFDDDKFITENKNVQSGINAESIKWALTASYPPDFWHPLTWLSHMLDWSLFGANAGGHHLVSLLWHIGSAILLFLFLSKTTGSLWPSAFVAALFALHPLRVESVAWAAERKDVLSVFFGLASLYAYAYYAESSKLSKYFLSLVLFVLSLMAKPMFITLPFVLLLLDHWPLGRWQKAINPVNMRVSNNTSLVKKKGKRRKAYSIIEKKISTPIKSRGHLIGGLLWEKMPFIFLSVALTIMVAWQLKDVGQLTSLQHLPLFKRVMNVIISYVSYLGKTFWPVDLAVFYPYQYALPLWQFLGALLILLLISAVVILYIRKLPFLFVGWFWYLGTLVPVIGLVQGGAQAMAGRYIYFPSIGIAIILTWGIVYLLPKEKLRKIILIPAAVILLSVLTFLTWQQCGYWKNSVSLFNHALQVTKNNYLAHYNLGYALKDQGKTEEALSEFREAVRIRPSFAAAHNSIGIILEMYYKKYDEAIYHYQSCLIIEPDNYGYHFNLGLVLAKNGNLKEAVEHFRQAVYLKPDFEEARRALKQALEMNQQRR